MGDCTEMDRVRPSWNMLYLQFYPLLILLYLLVYNNVYISNFILILIACHFSYQRNCFYNRPCLYDLHTLFWWYWLHSLSDVLVRNDKIKMFIQFHYKTVPDDLFFFAKGVLSAIFIVHCTVGVCINRSLALSYQYRKLVFVILLGVFVYKFIDIATFIVFI